MHRAVWNNVFEFCRHALPLYVAKVYRKSLEGDGPAQRFSGSVIDSRQTYGVPSTCPPAKAFNIVERPRWSAPMMSSIIRVFVIHRSIIAGQSNLRGTISMCSLAPLLITFKISAIVMLRLLLDSTSLGIEFTNSTVGAFRTSTCYSIFICEWFQIELQKKVL